MGTRKNIIVIEGPSGVGKDTVYNKLTEEYPNTYSKVASYTTRDMRPGEIEGITYFFVDKKTFMQKVQSGDIFEYTTRHGAYRGISKTPLEKIIKKNLIAVKDADVIGLRALRGAYPNKVLGIFITADKEVIKTRLIKRGGCDQDIERRLNDYDNSHAYINEYDYVIINNGPVEEAVEKIRKILEEENGTNA